MTRSAIIAEQLGKCYRIGQTATLRQRLTSMMRRDHQPPRTFWALRDVSFSLDTGRVLGVIGHNGAGKSTLLKVLSRITDPTTGRAMIRGRVASLLEVGTGFHPELTGRENIYLNGAILGLKRAEVRRHFDQIVEFAEVGRFLDTPVKRYSSGMYVRLAFAIAAHLEPEVLIVDEVLAVGDAAFQRRCLGKMGDVARSGRTVVFVSHNMAAVRNLCHEAILLDRGRVTEHGDVGTVIDAYLSQVFTRTKDDGTIDWPEHEAPGCDEVRLLQVQTLNQDDQPGGSFDTHEPVRIALTYRIAKPIEDMRWVIRLLCDDGAVAFATTDHDQRPAKNEPGIYRSICEIPAGLLNVGRYTLQINAGQPGLRVLVPPAPYLRFQTTRTRPHGSGYAEHWPGAVAPRLQWTQTLLEQGFIKSRTAA